MMSQKMQLTHWTRRKTLMLILLAICALGIGIVIFFSARAVRSFHELQYIHQQGLDNGTASVDAIRPWMTIRFIAVAYAVPEEYLYSALNIPFDQRNANRSLGDLNRDFQLGDKGDKGARDGRPTPVIVGLVQDAITEYRKNPVATGLNDVRPWMSIRYIANGSGVAEQQIFAAVGIASSGNENKPIEILSREQNYRGGPRALADAVQQALTQLKTSP